MYDIMLFVLSLAALIDKFQAMLETICNNFSMLKLQKYTLLGPEKNIVGVYFIEICNTPSSSKHRESMDI